MRFGSVTCLSFALNLGITIGTHQLLGFPQELSYLLALVVVFFTNFLLCKHFVYRAQGAAGQQLGRFVAFTIAMRSAEYLTYLLLLRVCGIHYVVSVLLVSTTFTVLKFALYGRHVFAQRDEGTT